MFVFSRRAIQQRLHELDGVLDHDQTDRIAARLNAPGRDRLAAMWEVVFLHAFSQIGVLNSEQERPNNSKPDIAFTFPGDSAMGLLADVTAVSDEGLDKNNPIKRLSEEIAREAQKVGLPPGGICYSTGSRMERVRGGEKVVLRLPSRQQLPMFIKKSVRPFQQRVKIEGSTAAPLVIDTSAVRLTLSYNGSRFTTGRYPAYDHARSLDANPIMNRLEEKAAKQLKGADPSVLKGVIVCDADCASMRHPKMSPPLGTFGPTAIGREFLRKHASFNFLIFATVTSNGSGFLASGHSLDITFVTSADSDTASRIDSLCLSLVRHFPKPIKSVTNAALRCREKGVGDNSIGGYNMSSNHIRVSARALVDVLSGKISPKEWESQYAWGANPLLMRAREGRGIIKAELMPGGDEDDDWIEFTFGPQDAAMAPFSARKVSDPAE